MKDKKPLMKTKEVEEEDLGYGGEEIPQSFQNQMNYQPSEIQSNPNMNQIRPMQNQSFMPSNQISFQERGQMEFQAGILKQKEQEILQIQATCNQIMKEKEDLRHQLEMMQVTTSLQTEGLFRYQLLANLQNITKQLNSISQQIYDSNQLKQSKVQYDEEEEEEEEE